MEPGNKHTAEQICHLLRLVLLASSHRLSLSSVSLLHWYISNRALHHGTSHPPTPRALRLTPILSTAHRSLTR
jgi:hypothetical protein